MQIALRIFVIVLGLIGAGGAVGVGYFINGVLLQAERQACQQFNAPSMNDVLKMSPEILEARLVSQQQADDVNLALRIYMQISRGALFLYAAGGLGLLGIILAVLGKGKCAGAVLLTSTVGPFVIMPPIVMIFLVFFIGALPVAGMLALFIGPMNREDDA